MITPGEDFLRDLGASLGRPSAQLVRRNRSGHWPVSLVAGDFLVAPNVGSPRLLIPVGHPTAARAVSRRFLNDRLPGFRLVLGARPVAAVGGRAVPRLVRDALHADAARGRAAPVIESRLEEVLGRPVAIGVRLGPPRANRKPVLHAVDLDGETLCFAKLGVNDISARLIRAESETLRDLMTSPLRVVHPPRVLYVGDWQDRPLLVLEPLPTRPPGTRPSDELLKRATAEIARLRPTAAARQSLSVTEYLQRLGEKIRALPASGQASALEGCYGALASIVPESLPVGCWHGDWTPWNMTAVGATLHVWDWERFGVGVPIGYDALHYRLYHAAVLREQPPARVVRELVAESATVLTRYGVPGRLAELTTALYLMELANRFLRDGQAAAGAALAQIDDWLLPELTRLSGDLVRR